MTKAVEGMTPYEAAFGKKPNLRGLREWGERVWVRVEKGNKLGGRVREGRWIGIDDDSKGMRVYWPDTTTVTVERNTYYDDTSASYLEGKNGVQITKTNADLPAPEPRTQKMFRNPKIPPKNAFESHHNEFEIFSKVKVRGLITLMTLSSP